MPVAVPTGDYVLRASVDLSPLHEPLRITKRLRIEQPPADVLDRILARLDSEDVNVRRAAIRELFWFPEDGETVVPALLEATKDPDSLVRMSAFQCLGRHPKRAAPHWRRFLKAARGGEGITTRERVAAAWRLAETAPKDDEVGKLLRSIASSEDRELRECCESIYVVYRDRFSDYVPKKVPR